MNLFEQIRDKTCPFRRLARIREQRYVLKEKDDALDRNDVGSSARMAPTSGSNGDISENVGTAEYNVHQSGRKNFLENIEFVDANRSNSGKFLENVGMDEYNVHWFGRETFTENMENVDTDRSNNYRFKKSKSLRSRRPPGYVIRPLDSLESCLAAQLCKEHEKMEEYVYSSLHSPSIPVLRPLLVTDGSRIISRAAIDSSGLRCNGREDKLRDSCLENINAFTRAPAAHNDHDELYDLQQKPKIGCSREQARSSGNRVSGGPFNPPGPPDEMILFFMGITIGIVSVLMANKREVDQLSKQLKQKQNLVQDLCEELEMKDGLTVRELANEASQPQRVDDPSQFNREPTKLSSERFDEVSKYDGEKQNDPMVVNSELKNKIEAELEAELERLELNLKASSLERIRDYVELDPDLEASTVVQGDTKVNVPTRRTDGASESDDEASKNANNYCEPTYYAVSPRELRLRLHEVIEARLESRIEELETALQSSESRLHSLESHKGFAFSEGEFSSTPQSPIYMYQDNDKEEPLVINLAGNALDAYNEAYAEMFSMTDSDKETAQALPVGNHIEKEMPPGRKPVHFTSFRENESTLDNNVTVDRGSRSLLHVQMKTLEEQTSRSLQSSEKGETDDEDDHELDMLLIQRIVEKKRSGAKVLVYGT